MTLKAKKIQIDALRPAVDSANGKGPINESVLRLARLVGKQIARERFEKGRVEGETRQTRTRSRPE
ncbi:hypothetical protein [Bradyrhizobium sp.]|uniref:hypothetical protein n=1 Tax=Bradyrhizobium sp. TaxID=376 RepID=UPI001EB3B084|nr:hypothetical protein [Bradyrhizobium sp.]MBV8922228.1 hypothetical protein [Bradyrhizobium sp.]MBV9981560.1 hypothetical protein [Bradyrhizobium sp.]